MASSVTPFCLYLRSSASICGFSLGVGDIPHRQLSPIDGYYRIVGSPTMPRASSDQQPTLRETARCEFGTS
jgi:hypothetical protein